MAGYVNSSKHKILTREEEIVLGKAVVAGQQAAKKLNECFIEGIQLEFVERRSLNAAVKEGKRAKDHFVEHNLRLAMDTAAKYARSQSRMEYEDLIQEATIGLMRAVDKFDVRRKVLFSSYAQWWIDEAIKRALSNQAREIRIPEFAITRLSKTEKAASKESDESQAGEKQAKSTMSWVQPNEWRTAKRRVLPEEVGKLSVVEGAQRAQRFFLSWTYDDASAKQGGSLLARQIADPKAESPHVVLEEAEMLGLLDRVLEYLAYDDPLATEIVRLRYGLSEEPGEYGKIHTLKDVQAKLGMSRSAVIERSKFALGRLADLLDHFLGENSE